MSQPCPRCATLGNQLDAASVQISRLVEGLELARAQTRSVIAERDRLKSELELLTVVPKLVKNGNGRNGHE